MTCVKPWALVLLLLAPSLLAQETPRPNRVVWFAGLPEPLPEGVNEVALEAVSQWLRPDLEHSKDQRTFARLDGEEWQLTGDWALPLGASRLNLRVRVNERSGGIADQAMWNWHKAFNLPQGGRAEVPKNRLAYHLERDGRVIADLSRPGLTLMDVDLAWVRPFGTVEAGGRFGGSIQLPTGKQSDFSGSGSTDLMVGLAGWRRFGRLRLFGQVEQVHLGLSQASPLRAVMDRTNLSRAWGSVGWFGDGPGFFSGLGLDLGLAWAASPYRVGLSRLDHAGLQQHWTFRHTRLPGWRFGFTEEAGTYVSPDVTAFVAYTFGGR